MQDLMGESYNGYDALEDVRALQKLTTEKLDTTVLYAYSFSSELVRKIQKYESDGKILAASFAPLVDAKVLSVGMAAKCAKSGLSLGHFQVAFTRDDVDGVLHLMQELYDNGKPRVNSKKSTIQAVSLWLKSNATEK